MSSSLQQLAPGTVVIDREDDDPDEAIVINRPPVAAEEWEVERRETTVAGDNPGYPTDDPVVIVAFRNALSQEFPGYSGGESIEIGELRCPWYAFPASRLEPVDELDGPVGYEATPEELAALEPLRDRLQGSADVEIDVTTDPTTLVVRKEGLGEEYRVTPRGTVRGEGALRERLREVVNEDLGGEGEDAL